MNLTLEQVEQMAPDAAAAAAGKKLVAAKSWSELGRSPAALWGKCQGSAVYQVKVDLANLGHNCSCPSRKFPCKHVLGLLMMAVRLPETVVQGETPAWVDEWLQKRREREEKQVGPKTEPAPRPADEKARQRRTEQRSKLVRDGLERLDLWMKDLVRVGLAEAGVKPSSFWEDQAKRLVDAQAPGLAARVARLASLPRASPDWATRLLGELGRIKLLLHAYDRLQELDPSIASDVRQLIGWNVSQDELEREGERLEDTWVVAGQWVDDQDRLLARRSWVVGRQTGRIGLILQFAPAGQPFSESIVAGTEQAGTLVFYPGASGQRAKFLDRRGTPLAIQVRPPGFATIDAFLNAVAESLARQPWSSAFGGVLHDVTLVNTRDSWWVRDHDGKALALAGQNHWRAMSLTGGHTFDLASEWDGYGLRALALFAGGEYWSL
jgi:hypothetical protein